MVRLPVALIGLITACLMPVAVPAREPCGVPEAATRDWRIETQAGSDIDPESLCGLIDRLTTLNANVHSVLIARHGALVFEHSRSGPDERWGWPLGQTAHGPDVKHDARSVSKSVVSLLAGIALDRKLIADIDQPVFAYFPEYAAARTPAKDRILLQHLLTMSSGFAWDENPPYGDPKNSEHLMILMPQPYRYVLDQPLAAEPGIKWNYSGGDVALLGAIIQKASGKRLAEFARETLFEPLGIADFEWVDMPSGEVAAASGLRLRPRDMAKLGQLALDGGTWKGRRIVSARWLTDSARPRFATETAHYGYMWWVASVQIGDRKIDWFEAFGLGGQRIIVIPTLDLVVIFTTGRYSIVDGWKVTEDLLHNFILPAIKPH